MSSTPPSKDSILHLFKYFVRFHITGVHVNSLFLVAQWNAIRLSVKLASLLWFVTYNQPCSVITSTDDYSSMVSRSPNQLWLKVLSVFEHSLILKREIQIMSRSVVLSIAVKRYSQCEGAVWSDIKILFSGKRTRCSVPRRWNYFLQKFSAVTSKI